MTSPRYRVAIPDDADRIYQLIRQVWPKDAGAPEYVWEALKRNDHLTWVAFDGDDIVGHADAFTTESSSGQIRWETDLLSVRPDRRRLGIGEALLRRITAAGAGFGATVARGFIRVENLASQRLFHKQGYERMAEDHVLLTWSERVHPRAPTLPGFLHPIPVRTAIYQGVWLELSLDIDDGRKSPVDAPAGRIGMMAPLSRTEVIDHLIDQRLQAAGRFQQWTIQLPA